MKLNDNKFGTAAVTKRIGISFERLRYWESQGIIHPTYAKRGIRKFRRYSMADIQKALFYGCRV